MPPEDEEDCGLCLGDGQCPECGGSTEVEDCELCEGGGGCPECGGSGKVSE